MSSRVIERDLGWNRIKKQLRSIDGSYTKVGVHQGAIHKSKDGELSDMVVIAAVNEFGTKRIPARPFMRTAIDENRAGIASLQDKMYTAVVTNVKNPRQALATLGEFATTKIKLKIKKLKTPPNAPSTIKKKKSSNPLIDQGQLVQSISHTEFVT